MALAWNIVAKNIHPHEQLQSKLREKISKLERYLQHFPPDAVHLQVSLDRHAKKDLFAVGLTLRIPLHILRSEKFASDPVTALDRAVKALLRELGPAKSALRHEALWKRRGRQKELHETKPLRFAAEPMAPGAGPQTMEDLVREIVGQHYNRLLYHIRLQIWRVETEGAIPKHAIDAEAVADEVVRQAISRAQTKPTEQSYRLWLYSLARQELERRFHSLREQALTSVPLDAANGESPGEADAADELVPVEGPMEADQVGDDLPDAHTVPPDLAAAEDDLVDYLQTVAQGWPSEERSVFELHFLEGFEPEEVAMLENTKTPEVKKRITEVQGRLRQLLTEAVQAKASVLTNRPKRGK